MLIKIRNKTSGIRTSIRTVNWTKRAEQDSECWRPQCNMKLKCAISKGYVFPSQVTNATGKNYHDHLKKTYWSSFLQSEILPKQEPKLQAKSHGWFDRTKTRLENTRRKQKCFCCAQSSVQRRYKVLVFGITLFTNLAIDSSGTRWKCTYGARC